MSYAPRVARQRLKMRCSAEFTVVWKFSPTILAPQPNLWCIVCTWVDIGLLSFLVTRQVVLIRGHSRVRDGEEWNDGLNIRGFSEIHSQSPNLNQERTATVIVALLLWRKLVVTAQVPDCRSDESLCTNRHCVRVSTQLSLFPNYLHNMKKEREVISALEKGDP